jgi:hypothetical protein
MGRRVQEEIEEGREVGERTKIRLQILCLLFLLSVVLKFVIKPFIISSAIVLTPAIVRTTSM